MYSKRIIERAIGKTNNMMGININCKDQDFVNQILNHEKTIETRNSPSLRCYIGHRVGLIMTGCGKAKLCGYATIANEVIYNNKEEFRKDYYKHLVKPNSKFDICKSKYGYVLTDVFKIEPIEINSRGIVARKIDA